MEAKWQDPPEYSRGGGVQFAVPQITWLVRWLLIANGAVFVIAILGFRPMAEGGGSFWRFFTDVFAASPETWKNWFPFLPLWQLVTYGFIHSPGSIMHLIGNMLLLYFLGTMLEGTIGTRRFGALYLVGLVLAGFCQLAVGLVVGSHAPIIGASGAVLAVVIAMATLRPQQRIIFILVPITLKTLAFIVVGIDVYTLWLEVVGGASSKVASIAHLTGAAVGFFAVRTGWIWRDPIEGFERWRARAQDDRVVEDEARLDELLKRINREGIHSLSSRERSFLKRVSKRR